MDLGSWINRLMENHPFEIMMCKENEEGEENELVDYKSNSQSMNGAIFLNRN